MSANDQERPLLAIIPESYPQTAYSWQGFDLWLKGKGVLAPHWWGWGVGRGAVRSGAADTVGCLLNHQSPFFSANRALSVVCVQH